MAELNYVKAGESIRANTINGIIDALGGPSIPTDGDFTNTSTGSLFRKSYSVGTGIPDRKYEFLDVKYAEAPSELSCGYKMVYVNLGKNLDFAKEKLDVDDILCFDGDSKTGFLLSNLNFYVNGTNEDQLPNFYDGYVCTNISSLLKSSEGEGEDKKEFGYGDGTLYGWNFNVKKEQNKYKVFVITNEYVQESVVGFLGEQGYSEAQLDAKRTLAVRTESPKGNVLIKMPNDIEHKREEDIRFRLRAREEKRDTLEGGTESRYHIEYYNGFFLKPDNTEDTGLRWNNRLFQNIGPNLALEWTELTATEWGKDPEDYTVYINLTATYQHSNDSHEDFHGQYEVSVNPTEENRQVDEGTNSITATYVVGTLKYRNGYQIDQNVLGELTFLELFDDNAISSAVDDIVPEILSNYLPEVDSDVPLLNLSSVGKYTYEKEGEGEKSVYEIFQFHNLENQVKLDDNRKANSDIIIRTRSDSEDKKPAIVEYLPLSALSSSSAEKISVDTEIENQTSSLQLLSTQVGEWYQLYNFNETNADVDAKIWTMGDLDSDKSRKVGKLIDPVTKKLLSVDILVRDNSTKQLKYMNLSVDSIKVDTYARGSKTESLMYSKEIEGGKYTDQNYLLLNNFGTQPRTKLSGVINNNGIVNITDENTWILTKKYDPAHQRMELTYDKLQLSVDLSAVSADIKCDTDSTPAQKSIEKNGGYIQLHDFDSPAITTKKTTLDNLSATYDLLDSGDSILVRSGSELKYKKLQIETKLPGGSGQTSGYTGSIVGDPILKWNTQGTYRIELWGKDMTYENGLLKSVGNERLISELETVGYSGLA